MAGAAAFMVVVDFMGAAVILVVVAMGGAVAVTAGVVAVMGVVGTAEVMHAVGPAEGMGVVGTETVGMVVVCIGMAVLPTGGGVTRTRMVTDLMVGNSKRRT